MVSYPYDTIDVNGLMGCFVFDVMRDTEEQDSPTYTDKPKLC